MQCQFFIEKVVATGKIIKLAILLMKIEIDGRRAIFLTMKMHTD